MKPAQLGTNNQPQNTIRSKRLHFRHQPPLTLIESTFRYHCEPAPIRVIRVNIMASASLADSQAFAKTQAADVARVTLHRPSPLASVHGGYSRLDVDGGAVAQPFFEDMNIVLSRPAHLRDYQADSAAYPFRTQRPDELAPHVAQPIVVPELPKMVFTSEAEQKWLQDRDLAARAELAAANDQRKDYSQPPPPFVSKLGFRSPEPMPPQPKAIKEFCHQDGVSKEFFWGGTGRFVSENGTANSQMYYRLARPLGGRLKSHTTTETTPYGYKFDQYTSRP